MDDETLVNDPEIEEVVLKLAHYPQRNANTAAAGRAQLLEQAQLTAPAVSDRVEERHRWRYNHFIERILNNMKPQLKYSALAAIAILAVLLVFLTNNIGVVSAQQVLERAAAAQSAAAAVNQGIRHTRIEVYENPELLVGKDAGKKTITESYEQYSTGKYRVITEDAKGAILSIAAADGDYDYSYFTTAPESSITVSRYPINEDGRKKALSSDASADTKTIFDQFNNNPRVKVEGKVTWPDGRQAYVLVNESVQTEKLTNGERKTNQTGITKMVFDAETYQLIQSQIFTRINGEDMLIYEASFTKDELLPENYTIAWNLSDLKAIKIVDEQPEPQSDSRPFEILSEEALAKRSQAYVLNPIPDGYSQEIVAVTGQPENEDYRFEINYKNEDGNTFGLMAIGKLETGFVETNFYDGSYKTAAGLVLYFSPSHAEPDSGTSAMLATPDGDGYLLFSSLTREQVEALAETLTKIR